MRTSRSWIRALWILWALSVPLLVGLWWLGLSAGLSSVLKARRVAALESLPRLEESFLSLQQLGQVLATTSEQEAGRGLTLERMSELRSQGEPYYTFYFTNRKGEPVLAGDPERPPEWLTKLLGWQGGPTVLRPLPPGFAAGQIPSGSGLQAPENYLVFVRRAPRGNYLLWQLRWDYVFETWLPRQLQRFGLGTSVSADTDEFLAPEPDVPVDSLSLPALLWSDFKWRWRIEPLLRGEVKMLDPLEITVENRSAVLSESRRQLPYLAAGLVLLAGFAFLLVLVERTLDREAEYTEAKARFVSMVSHELRTPITALEMYLEILREQLVEDPEKVKEYHRILQRESHRLKSLVENLLAVGLAEAGQLKLQKEEFDLASALRQLVERENRDTREVLTRGLDGQVDFRADREAVHGIFSNLLSNAFKFSPASTPIRVELDSDAHQVTVRVSDRGEGLRAEEYSELFQPYHRGPQKKVPGVGLGLALVRRLVESHGGTVRGEPRQGGGSVFTVQMPRYGEG